MLYKLQKYAFYQTASTTGFSMYLGLFLCFYLTLLFGFSSQKMSATKVQLVCTRSD